MTFLDLHNQITTKKQENSRLQGKFKVSRLGKHENECYENGMREASLNFLHVIIVNLVWIPLETFIYSIKS